MASTASSTISSPISTFTPAVKPPPGEVSDPDNPGSQIYLVNITFGICIPIVTILFVCRAYVRIFIKRSWITEDWFVLIAWAGVTTYGSLAMKHFRSHLGEHIWSITTDELHEVLFWFNVGAILYGVIICVAKIAILLLYRRIFVTRRWSPLDIIIVTLMAMIVIFYTATDFLKIFQCTPRVKIWIPSTPGTCLSGTSVLNASGLFNTITDFMIYFLPLYSVWKLKMSAMRKLAVASVFTFGLLAPVFSLAGVVIRFTIATDLDSTWYQAQLSLLSLAELTTATICASLAEVGPLFRLKSRERYKRHAGAHYYPDSATIVNGKRSNGIPTSFSGRSRNTVEAGPYIELGEPKRYTTNNTKTECPDLSPVRDSDIHIDHEFSVIRDAVDHGRNY